MSIETLTGTILRQMTGVNKWQQDFFQHLLILYLSLRSRYNFSSFSRWGERDEHTYRSHALSGFDFATFNHELIVSLSCTGRRRLLAFDPSCISKSGKQTAGVGYFWSGSAGKAKWGLELCAFAVVDVEENAALHYLARQTLPQSGQGLMDFYTELVKEQAESLKKSVPTWRWMRFFQNMALSRQCAKVGCT